LFHASIRDNVTFFSKSIKDEVILSIIKDIGLSSWFEALPEGLDTILDANGCNLSAGEAQLLAFVRVFLKNPRLVILDEASSRLDPATENLIQKAIGKLLYGRSGIIIAHRLSTLSKVDDIMILEEGKIIEFNKRELLEEDSNSIFHNLLNSGMEEVLA
jgi:ABC-type multidrug transport system fused ATPase/permease subunit